MYRVAVCDDEAWTRRELLAVCEDILCETGTEHNMTEFACAEDLEAALSGGEASFDLLLLDIMLDGKTGMELAQELRVRENRVSIIFITGMEEYLQEGYSVQPIQFLLKPVSRDALADALRTDLKLNHSPKTVSLRIGQRMVVLPVAEVLYAESQDHNIVIYTDSGVRKFPVSISELERLLPPERFCRCHNSFLVNMEHISELARTELTVRGGARVPISRKYYAQAQSAFIRYMNK